MFRYIVKRLIGLIPVIVGVTLIVFLIMSFSPGDPTTIILGNAATPEAKEVLREEMGLDDPVLVQYGRYMKNLVRGDFGTSYKTEKPVLDEIKQRFPYTLSISFIAIVMGTLISIPIGVLSATKQYSFVDSLSMVVALIGVSLPAFWLALMLIIVFSVNLGWLPSSGPQDGLISYILPSITIGVTSMAAITRTTRSSMLEVVRADYIRTAKAKGIAQKVVIRKHALKNALIPTVTIIGLQIGGLMGGAVLTETIFSWPGIGRLMVDSINSLDKPTTLGCIVIFAICFSLVNLAVDILYAFIDPRIKAQYR